MSALLERLGVAIPVVQAGMGGGLSGSGLASAVSDAGGLGQIGILLDHVALESELAAARAATGAPVAVNLLLPFARARHWEVAASADAVVTFWGRPRRRTPNVWIHQCGSVAEAKAAARAGADAVIAQGVEAGGHVRGTEPALELLARVRAALGPAFPVLLAGGIATRDDVRQALAAGADAAVLGTRFLMSAESGAHPGYKRRLAEANQTLLTELFGVGWPAPHRVVPNAATERWARRDPRGPRAVRLLNRATAPALARLPAALQARMTSAQRTALPVFGPAAAIAGAPDALLDASPLYAGETVARIADIRPARELVAELGP